MPITRTALTPLLGLFLILLCCCGGEVDGDLGEPLPDELKEVLARDEVNVRATTFDEGASISQSQALREFGTHYDIEGYKSNPTAYSVVIESSAASDLEPGHEVWVIHVNDVDQDITGPVEPPDEKGELSTPQAETITTDMFSFHDATSGRHLVTIYIGPPM